MAWRARLWELVRARAVEWADLLVVGPVRAHVDDRIDDLREYFTMASQNFDEAMQRFASVQQQGFQNVRSFISAEIERAQANGDSQSQANLARLDAGIDSLAAGFAQFAAAANSDDNAPSVPEGSLPPVINPDTPDPAETVSDPASGAPVDPVEVVNDPEVPTPADDATAGSGTTAPATADAGADASGGDVVSESSNAQDGPATA